MSEMKTTVYPERWSSLPIDSQRQTPIPWFVHISSDGTPRYDVIEEGKFAEAVRFRRCWICGGRVGRWLAFVVGPMCVINRISGEPPSHLGCGLAAAEICPFLTHPRMKRPARELPSDAIITPDHNPRNPGVCAVYITESYKVIPGTIGYLIEMGDFSRLHWRKEGRQATGAEIEAGLTSGFELLLEEVQEKYGRSSVSVSQFVKQYRDLLIRMGFKSLGLNL